MTLIRYLLEYTINNICHGKRSECARRLGLEYDELRRYYNRILNGGTSNRITEALLEMYWREQLSIDEALVSYSSSEFGSELERAKRICDELTQSVRNVLDTERQEAQANSQLLRAAYSFFTELEVTFCKKRCDRGHYTGKACPLSQFSEYLQMLQNELRE